MKQFLFFAVNIIFLFVLFNAHGQVFEGVIRGEVIDGETQRPLPGATVLVSDMSPALGSVTDDAGKFSIKKVPVGRHKIIVTYIGYGDVVLSSREVISGKELYVRVELSESPVVAKEVIVSAKKDRGEPLNEMAIVSAKTFTVEETSKYAGSWGDPSRMASRFAGVTISTDERNDIVVRGNSPSGMLWRLDGVDIPNPNHFSVAGSSGGAISMINNNLLDNSDFFTGAFPAEYGNAVSAVFDLHMRKGNNEKHEYFAQFGVNGFELGAEGPFSKQKKSSYLFSYRYSTLAVLDKLGVSIIDAVPVFQDLSFKLNFPLKKGAISVFGIGGYSKAEFEPVADSSRWHDNNSYFGERTGSGMGVFAVNYFRPAGQDSYFKIILSSSVNKPFYSKDSLDYNYVSYKYSEADYLSGRYSLHGFYNTRLGNKLKIKAGIIENNIFIHNEVNFYSWNPVYSKTSYSSINKNTWLSQAYFQGKYLLSTHWSLNGGFYGMFLFLNNRYSIEPRLSIKYAPGAVHSFSLGYGFHSQMQPLPVYYVQVNDNSGNVIYPNKNLDFIRSQHIVFSYERMFNEYLKVKTELYYQNITGSALGNTNPVYSLLNFGAGDDILTGETFNNNGIGKNYGAELTLEKYLNKGWYFLATGSLFNSEYRDGNKVWRNTRFNTQYAWNVLGGKEFKAGKNNVIGINLTIVNIGGQRYIPIDLSASQLSGAEVFIDSLAFTKQYSPYSRVDIRIRYRFNHKKYSQELAIELGNVFNRKNVDFMYYDKYSESIKYKYQLPRIPIVFYRIEF